MPFCFFKHRSDLSFKRNDWPREFDVLFRACGLKSIYRIPEAKRISVSASQGIWDAEIADVLQQQTIGGTKSLPV